MNSEKKFWVTVQETITDYDPGDCHDLTMVTDTRCSFLHEVSQKEVSFEDLPKKVARFLNLLMQKRIKMIIAEKSLPISIRMEWPK